MLGYGSPREGGSLRVAVMRNMSDVPVNERLQAVQRHLEALRQRLDSACPGPVAGDDARGFRAAALDGLLAGTQPGTSPALPHERLSLRELEVLRRIAAGSTGKAIAAELGVSQKTVSTCRARLLKEDEPENDGCSNPVCAAQPTGQVTATVRFSLRFPVCRKNPTTQPICRV